MLGDKELSNKLEKRGGKGKVLKGSGELLAGFLKRGLWGVSLLAGISIVRGRILKGKSKDK